MKTARSIQSRRRLPGAFGLSLLTTCLALILASTPATAQDVPFTGIVFQDDTQIHSGAGRVYYRVGELKKGDLVRVEEVIFGWNRIVPPQGVYSYISRGFVDVQGDGSQGRVNRDRAEVKAASTKGPGESYRVQCELSRGERVEIVDIEGSYYKIRPPAQASVFLPPGSVRRASAMEGADTPVEPAPQPNPVLPESPVATAPRPAPATNPEPVASQNPAQPQAPAEPDFDPDAPAADDETAPAAPQPQGSDNLASPEVVTPTEPAAPLAPLTTDLATLEERMQPLFAQPVDQQPLDEMISAYRALQDRGEDLPQRDQRAIEIRLAQLERSQRLAASISQVQNLRDQAQTIQEQARAAAAVAAASAPAATGENRFDAVGQLMSSSVYNGQSLPRLYRLVDPANGLTLGYIHPNEEIAPSRLLGQLVGLKGEKRFDPGLKLMLFRAEQIVQLESVQN